MSVPLHLQLENLERIRPNTIQRDRALMIALWKADCCNRGSPEWFKAFDLALFAEGYDIATAT